MIASDDVVFNFKNQVHQIEKKLYLSALSILRNPEDAKDALQESIYIAYNKINSLKDKSAFEFWLTKILIHESYRLYNKRKNYVDISDCEGIFISPMDESDLLFFDMISHLKKNDQTIIILRFYNEFSLEVISKMLKLPLSTVKSRLYRALKKIEEDLEV